MNDSQIDLEKQNKETKKRLIYPPYLKYKEKFIPTIFDVKTMNVIIGTKFIFEWNPVKALKVLV